MDETLFSQVEEAVLRRLAQAAPTALLVGTPPADTLGYCLTDSVPYDAVLIGSLTAGELLRPDGRVLDALLRGKPVYLWEEGLSYMAHQKTANRTLWAALQSAQRQLIGWGVRPYGTKQTRRLVTAQDAHRLKSQQKRPEPNSVLTPLAREILEGSI